ncbi:hypothetical protein CASFOL_005415 [Castilleja foliolosa]|uniref:Epidermal patterning factor-like protein n=1 Tax=Castilleja foliolosa TaxID=1961234 RepID=A0ABD3E5C8_9LAMI
MGIYYCQRQLTVAILMAFLLLAAVSALPLNPTPQPSVGGRVVPEEDGTISVPPSCIGRCEKCTPCKPVLVSVPPEIKRPLQYYPRKWKCQCGGKLYDP